MKSIFLFFIVFSKVGFAFGLHSLKSYKINPASITISGVSSGAYMAVQMEIAFSKTIKGVGSVAGGVDWCAQGNIQIGQEQCMDTIVTTAVDLQVQQVRDLAAQGAIDPVDNLKDHVVYIYASPKDGVINPQNSERLQKFYSALEIPSPVPIENHIESAHGFPTLHSGGPCSIGMLPWILNCNFDAAGEILKKMYGPLRARGAFEAGHLLAFSQSDFGNEKTPLFSTGWIYVPSDCANGGTCRLHVVLHGCQMNPDYVGERFVTLAGYNEWAETNHIIVLYPQSARIEKVNPFACWDWFGFTGPNYIEKSGSQMSALKKMIDRVAH